MVASLEFPKHCCLQPLYPSQPVLFYWFDGLNWAIFWGERSVRGDELNSPQFSVARYSQRVLSSAGQLRMLSGCLVLVGHPYTINYLFRLLCCNALERSGSSRPVAGDCKGEYFLFNKVFFNSVRILAGDVAYSTIGQENHAKTIATIRSANY